MLNKIELPDIDEMFSLIDLIQSLAYSKAKLELQIKIGEVEAVKEATNNPEYFIGGKSPSMAYIDSTYKITGLKGELIKLRGELSKINADLDNARLKFFFYKDLIDLYRTQSANERINLV